MSIYLTYCNEKMSVARLDEDCSNKIRKSQVITKVFDVVRELVDNAIDADAHSVKILLDNFGLTKIEVKDTGHGIPHEDVSSLFQGGYTSKLDSDSHLSCGDKYGFRGEALSAICSFSGLVVTSKRQTDAAAKKFVLSKEGNVTSENVVPCGNGTVIVVRDLFKDFPVRQKHCLEPKIAKAQLKDIEFYIKCMGICNPSVYFALHHNGHSIWSKPAVKNTEQALTTVLGVGDAKNLSNCLSAVIFPESSDKGWTGSLNLYVPQKPVDMKNMGYNNSKMTMIFVNRRLVVVNDYQNLIKRYAIGSADTPTQQEQKKFPLAVLMINVPPAEVDFNMDMDKSKIFLTCKEVVFSRLEDLLQSYYGVNLSVLGTDDLVSDSEETNPTTESCRGSLNNSLVESIVAVDRISEKSSMQLVCKSVSTPEKRKEHINAFLEGSSNSLNLINKQVSAEPVPKTSVCTAKQNETIPLSDFTISFDDLMDSQGTFEKATGSKQVEAEKENVSKMFNESMNSNATNEYLASRRNSAEEPAVRETAFMMDAWAHRSSSPPLFPGLTTRFEGVQIPQCGAVLHQDTTPRSDLGERLSLRRLPVFESLSKRPRISESFDPTSTLKSPEPPAKKIRQVTVEDLRRRDSSKPFRPISTGSPCSLLQRTPDSEPEIIKQFQAATSGKLGLDDCASVSFIPDLNSSSVFGLNSSVNLHEFSTWSNPTQKSILEENSSHVISTLGDTGTYIVKIDGLLGVFNPKKLLEIRPHLKQELRSESCTGGTSMDKISLLLQAFTAVIEDIDTDSAEGMFYILKDLEAFQDSVQT